MINFASNISINMETIKLNKSRSIKACIVDAWHLFALDWRKYLKFMAFPVLAAAMSGAFVFEMLLQYACQHLLPAYRLYQTGGDISWVQMLLLPSWAELLLLAASLLLLLVFTSFYKGKLLGKIHDYSQAHAFADTVRINLTAKERSYAFKYGRGILFFLIFAGLFAALITGASVKWQMRILYLLPLVLMYFWTTGNVFRLQYTLGGNKFMTAIKNALRKSLGFVFIVQILTIIPMLLLYAVFLLPACVYALSVLAAEDSFLVGDHAVMPSYLPVLFFLINTVGIAASMLFNSIRTWALVMKLNFFEESDNEQADVVEAEETKLQ